MFFSRILLTTVFAIFFILSTCKPGPPENQERYVNTKSGIVLRATPGKNGHKITLLKEGTKILLTGEKDKTETIDGKTGQWVQVKTGDKNGWVFDAFISDLQEYNKITLPPKFFLSLARAYNSTQYAQGPEEASLPLGLKSRPYSGISFALGSKIIHNAFCIIAGTPAALSSFSEWYGPLNEDYFSRTSNCIHTAVGYSIINNTREVYQTVEGGSQPYKISIQAYHQNNLKILFDTFKFDQNLKVAGIPFQKIYDSLIKEAFRENVKQIKLFIPLKDRFPEFMEFLSQNDENRIGNYDPSLSSPPPFPMNPLWELDGRLYRGEIIPKKEDQNLDGKILAFLVRRNDDGSLNMILEKLNEIMDAYDPEFASEYRLN